MTRAIILAAGKDERMCPLTLTTLKPLLEIHGKKVIDIGAFLVQLSNAGRPWGGG